MIGKALRSAGSSGGLVRYLFSRGRNGEHVDPRIVAGWDDPEQLNPAERLTDGRHDVRSLIAALDATVAIAGGREGDRSVYHLILASAKADAKRGLGPDRPLSDADWRSVAEDAVKRAGLSGCRWIAVRHDQAGAEHVHIVATLATEDGKRVQPRNDFHRIGEACRDAENRLGLRTTAPRDRTSTPRPTRAETENAARRGVEPTRTALRREVRAAVALADSPESFLSQLRTVGLLVRERHSERDGALTGYSVALPGRALARDGQPIFYGGGKLAADLTLPKLRARWAPATRPPGAPAASSTRSSTTAQPSPPTARPTLSSEERAGLWQNAHAAAARATERIAAHAQDPAGAAAAAWEASDFLASAARLVEGRRPGPLGAAAERFDRAARESYARTPAPSSTGRGLRAAGSLLAASRMATAADTKGLLALLAQLAALSDSLTRMREAQQRAAQAAAARDAAEQLRVEHNRRTQAAAARTRPAWQAALATAAEEDDQQYRPRPPRHGPPTQGRSR